MQAEPQEILLEVKRVSRFSSCDFRAQYRC